MDIIIVTGMSGSGKSSVIKTFEDLGYFCADNIPPSLFLQFFELIKHNEYEFQKVAIVVDSRLKTGFSKLIENLKTLKENGYEYKIVFVDANDEVLFRRYKESRRLHPLSAECDHSLRKAIAMERDMLKDAKAIADIVFDTTSLSVIQFSEKLKKYFAESIEEVININIMSFGFKHSIPRDCDLVFDIRCLPNPYYIPELKDKRGTDKQVQDYVLKHEESQMLLSKLIDLIEYLIPLYIKEGKTELVIGFGCTGGNHRSVTFAEVVGAHFKELNYSVRIDHRDINR